MNSSILVLWTTISVNTVPKFLIHNWNKNDLWFALKSSIRPNCLLPFVSSSPLWRHPFYALSLSNNFFSSIQFHLSLFYLHSNYRPSPSTIISAAVVCHLCIVGGFSPISDPLERDGPSTPHQFSPPALQALPMPPPSTLLSLSIHLKLQPSLKISAGLKRHNGSYLPLAKTWNG